MARIRHDLNQGAFDRRPSREDEKFALRHGMNPKAVAHALRGGRQAKSIRWRAWVRRHAKEAPRVFPLF